MQYIIDSANIEKIQHCVEYFPIDGVTTNPTIISREHANFVELIKKIRSVIGDERMLHIQVTGTTADQMIKEAVALQEYIGGNLYVKIPVSPDGLRATIELKKRGIKITETAIFTQQQAMIAAKAGADYVAPYVNRLDNIVSDGVRVVEEITTLFKEHNLDCKVLAASFKTVEQIHKIALTGAHAVTVNPELFDSLVYHPLTLYAIDDFMADWSSVYDDKKIIDMLK